LGPAQTVDVEAGHVLAFEDGMRVGIRRVGGLRTMLFGEEGIWLAHIEGPGRVWLKDSEQAADDHGPNARDSPGH
jgi:Uncharacterized conserved protein